jgi:hypothetical protein
VQPGSAVDSCLFVGCLEIFWNKYMVHVHLPGSIHMGSPKHSDVAAGMGLATSPKMKAFQIHLSVRFNSMTMNCIIERC